MPTADEYHRAALHLRRVGARLAQNAIAVRAATDPDRIVGGPLRWTIELRLDSIRDEIEHAHAELDRLAAICERRAEVCARFAAELLHRRRLADSIGRRWVPPTPPAWWVEL